MPSSAVDSAVHQAVSDVLVRYATGIDRRDWPLLQSCFTDDCECDYGDIGAWQSAEEITAFMRAAHAPCGRTLHRITNVAITANRTGVSARSYVDALVMMADGNSGVRAVGHYDDDLVETSRGWQIARRRFTVVLMQGVTNEVAAAARTDR